MPASDHHHDIAQKRARLRIARLLRITSHRSEHHDAEYVSTAPLHAPAQSIKYASSQVVPTLRLRWQRLAGEGARRLYERPPSSVFAACYVCSVCAAYPVTEPYKLLESRHTTITPARTSGRGDLNVQVRIQEPCYESAAAGRSCAGSDQDLWAGREPGAQGPDAGGGRGGLGCCSE